MAAKNNKSAYINLLQFDILSLQEDITPDGAYDYTVTYKSASDELRKVLLNNLPSTGGGGGGSGSSSAISQTGHGFSIGDVLYYNGSGFAKAKADTAASAEVIGIVSAVASASNFTISFNGLITGLSGLTAGSPYFLSADTAGALTSTEPTTAGHISKPVLWAISSTAGVINVERGKVLT